MSIRLSPVCPWVPKTCLLGGLPFALVLVVGCSAAPSAEQHHKGGAGGASSSQSASGSTSATGGGGAATFELDASVNDAATRGDGGCLEMEICGDGLDNDCNGHIDDTCPCTPGTVQPCYRGPASTRGVGKCVDGKMTCTGTEFGVWGECVGDVLPAAEVCDPGAQDENCDGTGNEGCECTPGAPPIPCGNSVGACKAGTSSCVDGKLASCVGAVGPTGEICDGIDNDCDGEIDEGLEQACDVNSTGICQPGKQTCKNGQWGPCVGSIKPVTETCNGLDDNCNGSVDENVTKSCGTSNVGECKFGVQTCSGGTFGSCVGNVEPTPETCNNKDDDCDGVIDNGVTQPCGNYDKGICKKGIQTCSNGVFGACVGKVDPLPKELCNGVDDTCDGVIDEGCDCTDGATQPCGSNVGACKKGTQTCTNGKWGACNDVGPTTESCNNVDSNCNGTINDGCACVLGDTQPCGVTNIPPCALGKKTCDIHGVWGPCVGNIDPAPTETCYNGIDDNCSGTVDENCPRRPPTVACPADTSTFTNTKIALNGSATDPDKGTLTYVWAVSSAPSGSQVKPSPTNTVVSSFTPDVAGSYVLSLTVTNDAGLSKSCTVAVSAASSCTAPTNPSVSACGTSWDRRPVVQFDPLPAGLTYQVFRSDTGASISPVITTAGQNYFRPTTAIDVGGPIPGKTVNLYVKTCKASDATCCSVSAEQTVKLVEACTTPVTPTTTNMMFSEWLVSGTGGSAQSGEAIEITNLSNCPLALNGIHFSYRNSPAQSSGSERYMNFTADDVVPPRGVYVAVRDAANSTCTGVADLPNQERPGLFGLKISQLAMNGPNLTSGWFNNDGGFLILASGAFSSWAQDFNTNLVKVEYKAQAQCTTNGYDAVGACGDFATGGTMGVLPQIELGRLWHPCDAVLNPVPSSCRVPW